MRETPDVSRDPSASGLWGSCRQSEVTSAVIQKTATRRSKQTRQHRQHKHKQGSTDVVPPTGWVRECRTELGVTGGWSRVGLQMLNVLETTQSHPKYFLSNLCFYRCYLRGPRMPYSPKDPGIFMSLNLRAASCTCCHGGKKWKLAGGFRKVETLFNLF